ncbi:MAG: PKD domain-containing protein [Bacteroidales bacterium]|nr:PKD domain-containing protein [Bacteroidales bacterium]MDY3913281.1 PKD domain-containing protein [Sodaliphilus sp.]
MKLIKNIGLLAMMVLMLAMTACTDKEPNYGNFPTKDVDFTYNVDGNEYTLDFYVVSKIKFNNISVKKGNVSWDFGDGSTSTEQNPVHKFAKAGLYQVKLTVEGAGTRTYPLLVSDIAPVLSVTEQSAPTVVINDVTVDLGISLPNPEHLKTKYVWKFPEGTLNADGQEMTEFVGYEHEDGTIDNPGALKFRNIGSQKIELQTWFDVDGENRRLEDSYVNVQVGYNQPAPTVYYATYGGNVKAYKIIDPSTLPAGTKNLPFDMGISAGTTPMNLVFANVKNDSVDQDYVYILDAGKQYTYVNDEADNLGDGKITVMAADGSSSNVVVTNVGGQAFNDPFEGCADANYLYYTDRNTGIRRVALSSRGGVEKTNYKSTDGYMVVNNQLTYYGQGMSYGAIHTSLYYDKNQVFWWVKNYSGNGVYRFKASDIKSSVKAGDPLPYPIVLAATQPRAFTLDEDRNAMYVWYSKGTTPGVGFAAYTIPAANATTEYKNYTTFIGMDAAPENTTADEGLYVTQFAVDKYTGNVFFGFRAGSGEKTYTTGLYYFDYNTKKMVNYCGNKDRILGVCINPRKTNLF